MPSKKTKHTAPTPSELLSSHIFFIPFLVAIAACWLVYRFVFDFPVWFDETLGKGLLFGVPVWAYIIMTRAHSIQKTYEPRKLLTGLLFGVAVGGVFGFTTSIMALLQSGATPQPAALYMSDIFWAEFFLAGMTGFWESLLFFSFIYTVIEEKWSNWPLWASVLLTVSIFVLFHIPNAFLRFEGGAVVSQIFLLTLFALGQTLLFISKRNMYALVVTHAIWGMVLLLHGQ
ncbi:hypothetical protein KC686_01120 [Candidatus Woesebacteria bacterium]|nr:hypothetical protein [Candidatus Woesebacteria bacterium]